MFDRKQLEEDSFFRSIGGWLLTSSIRKIGTFLDIHTLSDLIDKLLSATYIFMKHLPKANLDIYLTNDLGFGYQHYLSPNRLNELIQLNQVKSDVKIKMAYRFGNLFTSILKEEVRDELLITNDVYVIVHSDTKEIYGIYIGKPTNPNWMYYKDEIPFAYITMKDIQREPLFNRIEIEESINSSFDL